MIEIRIITLANGNFSVDWRGGPKWLFPTIERARQQAERLQAEAGGPEKACIVEKPADEEEAA